MWSQWPFRVTIRVIVLVVASLILPGCAVYYRDRDSGAEHIWGFGHLSMKVISPGEEKQAIIQRTTLTGAAVGIDNGSFGMSLGYAQREHILIYDENVEITIQRPPSEDFCCAVNYSDSGAEHIWGFGHLSMKIIPPVEEKQAIIQRTTLTGAAVGIDNGSLGMSLGYDQREHILIYDENVGITIQRPPSNDFFSFKIGTYPFELESLPDTKNSPEKKENQP